MRAQAQGGRGSFYKSGGAIGNAILASERYILHAFWPAGLAPT